MASGQNGSGSQNGSGGQNGSGDISSSTTSTSTDTGSISSSTVTEYSSISQPITTSSTPSPVLASSITTLTSPYYTPSTAALTPASTTQKALSSQSGSLKSGNLSTGVAAGAAVATAVGGALLAFILTFIFMRRRTRKHLETHRHSEKRQSSGATKTLLKSSSDDLVSSKYAWEKHLPQPTDDNSIRLAIKTFFHQVELHVENFYTDSAAPSAVSEEAQIELQKLNSPFLPKPVTVVLPQAHSKTTLIKHCLAQLIVKNITTDGIPDRSQSFLPLEFVALPHTIARTHSNTSKPGFSQSLSRWRVLTSYLHPAPTTDPAYIASRESAIATAASTFCTAFAPWSARTQSYATRLQNLVTIMQGAADAGVMIFAQPAAFRWMWEMDGHVRGNSGAQEIVVTPGFVKVTDDDAKVLGHPQVMVQQVVHAF